MAKNIHINGAEALAKVLAMLPANIEKNIMRGALRAGAKIISDEAKQNAPVDSGNLKNSFRLSTNRKKGEVSASVKAGNKKAFYYKFVEFGTQPHLIKVKDAAYLKFIAKDGTKVKTKQVHHTGAIEKPFMRPALDKKTSEAIVEVGDYIRMRLEKEGMPVPEQLSVTSVSED